MNTIVPLLELRGLSLGYGESDSPDPFIVHDAELTLSVGEFVLIEGGNGSGKSTFLRGLLGLVPRSQGNLRWNIARTEVGYVPQEAAIEPDTPATALDVVRAADPANWAGNRPGALGVLDQLGLGDLASKRFSRLSGGQRRRVLFARALLGSPRVLLLDEPTANVDAETETAMESWIHEVRVKYGTAVLAISHVSGWARDARRLRMERGRLLHG